MCVAAPCHSVKSQSSIYIDNWSAGYTIDSNVVANTSNTMFGWLFFQYFAAQASSSGAAAHDNTAHGNFNCNSGNVTQPDRDPYDEIDGGATLAICTPQLLAAFLDSSLASGLNPNSCLRSECDGHGEREGLRRAAGGGHGDHPGGRPAACVTRALGAKGATGAGVSKRRCGGVRCSEYCTVLVWYNSALPPKFGSLFLEDSDMTVTATCTDLFITGGQRSCRS